MTIVTIILLGLLAGYLASAALFVVLWRDHIAGGWFQTLVSALAWPAVLVALFLAWKED